MAEVSPKEVRLQDMMVKIKEHYEWAILSEENQVNLKRCNQSIFISTRTQGGNVIGKILKLCFNKIIGTSFFATSASLSLRGGNKVRFF